MWMTEIIRKWMKEEELIRVDEWMSLTKDTGDANIVRGLREDEEREMGDKTGTGMT